MNRTEEAEQPRWYVLHAYSGHEGRVKQNLEQRVSNMDMGHKILEVFVPQEDEIEIQGGQRKTVSQRVFPGYIFVHMRMDDESWHIVRSTPGVTGFVSAEDDSEARPRPVPLDSREEQTILGFKETDQPRVRVGFTKGQAVRITDGPFVDFMGVVDEVHVDRTKLKVLVSFFGRETPVELDFLQVERA